TSREWEVLDLLSAGLTIDDITNRFVVSPETVRSHLKHIMRKLGVRTVAEAVETARRLRAPY
ncbi:MAG: response regulator transcription factor, partial [Solirubrobacteraceae bacterium]